MAISFSRPDPSSPASVADAAFGTSRRGFDQQEVRDFLRMVAAEMARLQERERFLERELRTAQSNAVPADGSTMDDDTATRLLGEEAARILQTAREGGASIRSRAEDGAAQLLREAGDEARRVREEADLEAGRRRADAAADAEAELSMAKQQGREMVEEARAYRERVLSELSRRRDLARQQIEQLVHGRDRLLQAFERARLVAVDVVAELSPLGEPDEYVDLTPTTGPVPIMVRTADLGDVSSIDASVYDVANEEPDVDIVAVVEVVDVIDDAEPPDDEPDVEPADDIEDAADDEVPPDVVELAVVEVDDPEEIDDDDVTATDVDALFARLRAVPPPAEDLAEEDVADAVASDDDDDEAETPFRTHDAALVPLIVTSARKLKRVLADEQNDVLEALRRKEPIGDLDAARYTDAVTVELIAAVEAGAAAVGGRGDIDLGPDGPLAAVRGAITAELIAPLRERLDRAVVEGDGDHDAIARRVRGVYREWKTQRIDEQLDDVFRLAYCQGSLIGLGAGASATWAVDPDGPPSPDCEDNALAGPVPVGDAFPSGHVAPPMHPGCRCLLLPVDG